MNKFEWEEDGDIELTKDENGNVIYTQLFRKCDMTVTCKVDEVGG